MTEIKVDYSKREGSPLFKKFHMFNSGLAPISRYEENIDALQRLRPESIRIDLFLGDREQEFGDVIDGTAEHPVFQFQKIDYLAEFLIGQGIKPYWSWCYIPLPLQPEGGTFKDGPTDFEKYGEFIGLLSHHYYEEKIQLGWQEIFNEADCCDNLYNGSFQDYLRMYRYAAPAAAANNPLTPIGGPAEAFYEDEESVNKNIHDFIDLVRKEQLPLDYFSYHTYGYEKKEYLARTRVIQRLLESRTGFETAELHMNELNILPPPWEYGKTHLTDETVVPLVLDCMEELLEIHDLTVIHWAQLFNSGVDELSLVSLDHIYYPAFYVFEVYNRMPAGRCAVRAFGKGIKAMAAGDSHRASVLLWNSSGKREDAEVRLDSLKGGEVDVYIFDREFYQAARTSPRMKMPLKARIPVINGAVEYETVLEADEMIYFESNISEQEKKPYTYGKKSYYFEERLGNDSYAYFEERFHTFYCGTGTKHRNQIRFGILMFTRPDMLYFEVRSNRMEELETKVRFEVRGSFETTGTWYGLKEMKKGIPLPQKEEFISVFFELNQAEPGIWCEFEIKGQVSSK